MTARSLLDAQAEFDPDHVWLNTATYGLPPASAFDAFEAAAREWRHGRTGFDGWDRSVGAARERFARLTGVGAGDVAIGSAVSPFAGLVAGELPAGARVLAVEGDFTSVLFPFLAQEARGVRIELVPLERLAEAIAPAHDVVAFSAVQSADGRVADLAAVADAAAQHGVRTFVDATQAAGWLPLDLAPFDFTATAAYKWLLSPRGTAFFTIRPERRDELVPHTAGWYAGEDVPSSYYGAPLRLAADARRFDTSPAWLNWVGAAGRSRCWRTSASRRSTRTTWRSRRGCATGSGWSRATRRSSRSAGCRTTRPTGSPRPASWRRAAAARSGSPVHLYTTDDDVDRALAALSR